MTMEDLTIEVTKLLTTEYDFLVEEAEEEISESQEKNPDLWHEDAVPGDLAKYLASDESDE